MQRITGIVQYVVKVVRNTVKNAVDVEMIQEQLKTWWALGLRQGAQELTEAAVSGIDELVLPELSKIEQHEYTNGNLFGALSAVLTVIENNRERLRESAIRHMQCARRNHDHACLHA